MGGFTNRDQLRSTLKQMPAAVRAAVARQIEANAQELVETQKRFADAVFADPTGDLQRGIHQVDASTKDRVVRRVISGAKDEKGRPKADWIEHGTSRSAAKPSFWPAYRLKKRAFKSRVSRAAKKAIKDLCK